MPTRHRSSTYGLKNSIKINIMGMESRILARIEIDPDYVIKIDRDCWGVSHNRIVTQGKDKGKRRWKNIGWCRDLPSALICVMREKTKEGHDVIHVTDYMKWYQSTINVIADRCLRKEKELKMAIDKNKSMVSYHNFE